MAEVSSGDILETADDSLSDEDQQGALAAFTTLLFSETPIQTSDSLSLRGAGGRSKCRIESRRV
jgi:hypothetical protein